MKRRSWTPEQLTEAVKHSFSFRQVIAKLGLRPAGGNYTQLKRYIAELQLDTSHFKGRGWNRGLVGIGIARIPLEAILVQGSSFQNDKLKKRLFKAGLKPEQCERCGWAERTPDGYLPLELDHLNGDPNDNRLENLKILCPNCHSLTFSSRSRRRNT
jgi:hypothetical protein